MGKPSMTYGGPEQVMSESGFVVAVNNDKHAAIFNVADVCIVEDLTTFIPLLVDECLRGSSRGNSDT
jgi:lipoprotein signal peptidase